MKRKNYFVFKLRAPEGHLLTCATMVSVLEPSIFTQGLALGLKTLGRPFQQLVE